MKKAILSVIAAFVALTAAQAQFYIAGDDPGSLKWNYIRTPNYKVIYPVGTDSLARAYARALETNRTRVALSAGYLPGETYWRTTPVVLHTHTAHANGSVGWAPMRMDLYTFRRPTTRKPCPGYRNYVFTKTAMSPRCNLPLTAF